jgi:hypothetical protein
LIVTPVIFYSLRAWKLRKQTNARDEEAESPGSEVAREEEILQD